MDEINIYLKSTESMNVYTENTMAAFLNLVALPIQLEGDCRVSSAEVMFPTSFENFTRNNYFIYTPNLPLKIFFLARLCWRSSTARELGRQRRNPFWWIQKSEW